MIMAILGLFEPPGKKSYVWKYMYRKLLKLDYIFMLSVVDSLFNKNMYWGR